MTENFFESYLSKSLDFPYHLFFKYNGDNEGLAVLSCCPFEESFFLHTSLVYAESNTLNVIVKVNGLRISFTNVHLPWNLIRKQERQMVEIGWYIYLQDKRADFFILLGDFNGNINFSVHRFLLRDQTINGNESNLY